MNVRHLTALVILSSFLAVLATGCGGSTSPEEEWAGSVCSDIGAWKSQLQDVTDDIQSRLQSPQEGMLAAIDADIHKAIDATDELAANLAALDPPDSDEGAQAKQQLDAFSQQLQATADRAKTTVENVPNGADEAEIAKDLASLAPELQSLAVEASSTLAALQAQGEALKKGFEEADSCNDLRDD